MEPKVEWQEAPLGRRNCLVQWLMRVVELKDNGTKQVSLVFFQSKDGLYEAAASLEKEMRTENRVFRIYQILAEFPARVLDITDYPEQCLS